MDCLYPAVSVFTYKSDLMKLHLPKLLYTALLSTFAVVAQSAVAATVTAWETPYYSGSYFTWTGGAAEGAAWDAAANWVNDQGAATTPSRVGGKGYVMVFGDNVNVDAKNLGHGKDTSDGGGIIVGNNSVVTCGLGSWAGYIQVGENSVLTTKWNQQQKGYSGADSSKKATNAVFYVDGTLILDQTNARISDGDEGSRKFHIGKKGFINFSKVTSIEERANSTLDVEVVLEVGGGAKAYKNRRAQLTNTTRQIFSTGANFEGKFDSFRFLSETATPGEYNEMNATVSYSATGISVTYQTLAYSALTLQGGGDFVWSHEGSGWTVQGGIALDTTFLNGDSVVITKSGTATVVGDVVVADFTLNEGVSYVLDVQADSSITFGSGSASASWGDEELVLTGSEGSLKVYLNHDIQETGDGRIMLSEASTIGQVVVSGSFAYNLNNESVSSSLSGSDLRLEDGSNIVIRNGVTNAGAVDAEIGDILVDGNATLNVYAAADATINDKIKGEGTLDKVDEGAVTFAGGLELNKLDISAGKATIVCDAELNSLTVGSSLNLNDGEVTTGQLKGGDGGASVININQGATLNVTGTTGHDANTSLQVAQSANGGTLNLNGGTLNAEGAQMFLSWDGTGTFNAMKGVANINGINAWANGNGNFKGVFNLGSGDDGSARVNLGEAGMKHMESDSVSINLGAGTLGSYADWSIIASSETAVGIFINLTSTQQGTTIDTLDSKDNVTAHTVTFQNGLSGNGKLVKTGAGTLVLNGAAHEDFTGSIVLEQGDLIIKDETIIGGGKLLIGRGNTVTLEKQLGVIPGYYMLVDSTLGVFGNGGEVATLDGELIFGGGTLSFDELSSTQASLAVTGTITLVPELVSSIEWDGTGMTDDVNTEYQIIGNTGLEAGETNSFVLSGVLADEYKGSFKITEDGTLVMTVAERTDVCTWDQGVWDTVSSSWTQEGTPVAYLDGEMVHFTDDASDKTVTIEEGVTVTPSRIVIKGQDYIFTGAGSIAGTGSMRVANGASVTIENANSYTGGTEIADGAVVTIKNSSALGHAAHVTETRELGAISGEGTLVIDAGDSELVIARENAAQFTGTLQIKSGSLYAGQVSDSETGANAALRASDILVEAGAAFYANFGQGSLADGFGFAKVVNSDIVLESGATLGSKDGCVEYTGNVHFNAQDATAGTLAYEAEGATGLHIQSEEFINFSGVVEGSGEVQFTSDSAGSYIALSNGSNTFNGTYAVNSEGAGIVICTDSAAKDAGIKLNAEGAYLRVQTGDATIVSLNGDSAGALVYNTHTSASTLTVFTGTYAGAIKDSTEGIEAGRSLSLVKQGSETLTLSGAMQYSGVTRVEEGTLAFAGTEPLTLASIAINATAKMTTDSALTLAAGASLAYDMESAVADDEAGIITLNAGVFGLSGSVCALNITNAENLADGEYKLISWTELNSELSIDKFDITGVPVGKYDKYSVSVERDGLVLSVDSALNYFWAGGDGDLGDSSKYLDGIQFTPNNNVVFDAVTDGSADIITVAGDEGIKSIEILEGGDYIFTGAKLHASNKVNIAAGSAVDFQSGLQVDNKLESSGALKSTTISGEGDVYISGGSLELSGENALSNTGDKYIGNTELKGEWSAAGVVLETGVSIGTGAVITLTDTSIGGTMVNEGTLNLAGNINITPSADFESQLKNVQYSDGDNGIKFADVTYVIANGNITAADDTIWSVDGVQKGEYANGRLRVREEQLGTVYWANKGTVSYTTGSLGGATGIVLNGAEIVLNSSLEESFTDGIQVQRAGRVVLSSGVTLDANQIKDATVYTMVTLDGTGTYNLGSSTAIEEGVTLAQAWRGTVQVDAAAVAAGADVSLLGNAASTIAVSGDLTLGTAESAASLVAGSSILALEGTLTFANTDSFISAGTLALGEDFNMALGEFFVDSKDMEHTLISLKTALSAEDKARFELEWKDAGYANLYNYETKWSEDGTTLVLKGALNAQEWAEEGKDFGSGSDQAWTQEGGNVVFTGSCDAANPETSGQVNVAADGVHVENVTLVVIDDSADLQTTYTFTGGDITSTGKLTIASGMTLNVENNTSFAESSEVAAESQLNVNGGTVVVGSDTQAADLRIDGGSLSVADGGTVEVKGALESTGSLTVEAGSVLKAQTLKTDSLTINKLDAAATTMVEAGSVSTVSEGATGVSITLSEAALESIVVGEYKLLSSDADSVNMTWLDDASEQGIISLGYNVDKIARPTADSLSASAAAGPITVNRNTSGAVTLVLSVSDADITWNVGDNTALTDRNNKLNVMKDGVLLSDTILDNVDTVKVSGTKTLDMTGVSRVQLNNLTAAGSGAQLSLQGNGRKEDSAVISMAAAGFDGTLNLKLLSAEVKGKLNTLVAGTDVAAKLDVTDTDVVVKGKDVTLTGAMNGGNLMVMLSEEASVAADSTLEISGTDIGVIVKEDGTAHLAVNKGTNSVTVLDMGGVHGTAGDIVVGQYDEKTDSFVWSDTYTKYFVKETLRLEDGKIVADRNTTYYADKVTTELSANAAVGLEMADAALVYVNPKTDGTSALGNALSMLETATGESADELYANLAGASTAVLGMAVAGDIDRQLQAIRNRTTTMGVSQEVANEDMPYVNAWINAEGDSAQLSENGTESGYDLNSWGGTVGVDVDLSPGFTAGVALTAMYGDLDTTGADKATGNIDTYYLTAFARYAPSAWTHTFVATIGMSDISLDRTVGGMETSGETSGTSFGFLYEVGRVFSLDEDGEMCLQPVFNVTWKHTSVDAYTEEGTDAALEVDEQTVDTLSFGLGARFQAVVGESTYNRTSVLETRVLAKMDVGDRNSSTDVTLGALKGISEARSVESAEMGAFGLEAGAGLTIPVGQEGSSIFMDASVELRSDYLNVNGTVGYRVNF